jgi:Uma2 family endonuclease
LKGRGIRRGSFCWDIADRQHLLARAAPPSYRPPMQQDLRKRPAVEIVLDAPSEPDAFLRWSADRPREEGRYELSHGVVTRTMINVTRRHGYICTNIMLALGRVLDLDFYGITSADFAVRTPVGIRGPDILVEAVHLDGDARASDLPLLLAEVLSPSTAGIDFSDKRDEYLGIASLRTYLICAQDEARVWLWARGSDGNWPTQAQMIEGRDAIIALGGLGAEIEMSAIYRGIPDQVVDP